MPLPHLRGYRAYAATNPKTREVFRVNAYEERYADWEGQPIRKYVLEARPKGHEANKPWGHVILLQDLIIAAWLGDYPRVHSEVEPDFQRQGVGTLLYLTAAVFTDDIGGAGIASPGGSRMAEDLWGRLLRAGLATRASGVWRLDGPVARRTGLVQRLRR